MISQPFSGARSYVRVLKLKNPVEWREYCKSGKKPRDIPAYPDAAYKQYWKGWYDWLGPSYVTYENKKFRSFNEVREFVRTLGLDWRRLV